MKYKAQYNIPLEIYNDFKSTCQEEGRTMTGTIIMLIKVWLKGIRERGD